MGNIAIAELRRRMPVGTKFTAEYMRGAASYGLTNTREVIKQSNTRMISRLLDGPKSGQEVTCEWRGVEAIEGDWGIELYKNEMCSDPFVRFCIKKEK